MELQDGLFPPMPVACKADYDQIVEMLIDQGADVNAQDADGFTALINAIVTENVPCVQKLLQAGASVSICDKQGRSPLHIAALCGNLKIVNFNILILDSKSGISTQSLSAQTLIFRFDFLHTILNIFYLH